MPGLLLLNNLTENEIEKEFNAQQLYLVKDLSKENEIFLTKRLQLIDILSLLTAFQNQDTKLIISDIDQFLAYENKNNVRTLSLYNDAGTILYSSNKKFIGHKLVESEIFMLTKNPGID